jgi:shikimate dehydrogenase
MAAGITIEVMIDRYAVVGNPVSHSLSPKIHRLFALQTQQSISYEAIELPLDDFAAQIREFQLQGMKGLNVTVPFKQQAWEICDQRTARAETAGAVNTIIFSEDGSIVGDNTDGAGLIRDLEKNHHIAIQHCKILILGAGGAVRGVLEPLIALAPDSITIANRTPDKARRLASDFQSRAGINACGYDELSMEKYDLIINATAAGLNNQVPPVPESVLASHSICYDMMYKLDEPTAFVHWARSHGVAEAIDGLGMLVEQAAESFFIWRGVAVNTAAVIADLRHP